jgi:glycosyltransferase involved in cell wall biosynthesis
MYAMKRVLFVHNQLTRFVQIDRDLLAERYKVTEQYETGVRHLRPLALKRLVRDHDFVFAWFASWHSFLPVWFARRVGKPSIVVVGGYDTACVPEANYGSQRGGVRKWLSRAVMKSATHLVANSQAAKQEAVSNAGADESRISVIYHGVNPVPPGDFVCRQKLVLTVGNVWRENLLRKGLLPFVQAATLLPDVRFVHVGRWCDRSIDELRRAAGPNVEFRGFLPDGLLFSLYAQASVYVQASMHEGFGLSVAEAMSAGCIPVVTRAGSLPEVVGDTGICAESARPQDLAWAIMKAMELDNDVRKRARARILSKFNLDQRRLALLRLVESLMESHRPVNRLGVTCAFSSK